MLTQARRVLAAKSLITGALVMAAGITLAPAAQAALPTGGGVECKAGQCTVVVTTPSKPGGSGTGSSGSGRGGAGRGNAQPVRQETPREPGAAPAAPGGINLGTTWACVPSVGGVICDPPAAAPGAPAVIIDPDQVAQMAVSRLAIAPPDIQLVPKPEPGGFGFIGLPVWLWTPQAQWAPLSATASVGAVTVTATAQLSSIDFDMGDGTVVRCDSPGMPYQASFGDRDSPTCGHRYSKTSAHEPNQEYTITATANYDVTWAGAATGATTLDAESTTALAMGERQILVTVG